MVLHRLIAGSTPTHHTFILSFRGNLIMSRKIADYEVQTYPQTDNNWWEPAGHYVRILCNDKQEAQRVKDLLVGKTV